jgi:hypothetical protein
MPRPARLHIWFFWFIPCPQGISESRYPPNTRRDT